MPSERCQLNASRHSVFLHLLIKLKTLTTDTETQHGKFYIIKENTILLQFICDSIFLKRDMNQCRSENNKQQMI